jgi:hypothetical protein
MRCSTRTSSGVHPSATRSIWSGNTAAVSALLTRHTHAVRGCCGRWREKTPSAKQPPGAEPLAAALSTWMGACCAVAEADGHRCWLQQ